VVLGPSDAPNGGYAGEAERHGGIYFQMPSGAYDAIAKDLDPAVGRSLVWAVNRRFLIQQMQNGVPRIDFVIERTEHALTNFPASYRAQEIRFLDSFAHIYGYERQGSSWVRTR
jgi:hypothetical protein